MKTVKTWVAAATMLALSSAAYAAPVFQGRLADGTASVTCTVSGATKCAMFYNTTLDVTILNDWNIGRGFWSAAAAAGSAQALAESAGAAQTDFTGWFLPTGNFTAPVGALNQYLSILGDVGGLPGLSLQFDGVQSFVYWSGSAQSSDFSWRLNTQDGSQGFGLNGIEYFAVAVRPGDVAGRVPEPASLTLLGLGCAGLGLARRRRG